MEVASVVRQTLLLIFFWVANGHGQIPLQYSSSNLLQAVNHPEPVVARISNGPIYLQDFPYPPPRVYAEDTADYRRLPQQYNAEVGQPNGRLQPDLFEALLGTLKNTAFFMLGLLDLTDADRHDSLRLAANDLNAALDSISAFVHKVIAITMKILRKLQKLPIIGVFFQLAEKVNYVITYIPFSIFEAAKKLLRSLFVANPKAHPGYQAAYAYS